MARSEDWPVTTTNTMIIEGYIDGDAQLERPLGMVQSIKIEGRVEDELFYVETTQGVIPKTFFQTDSVEELPTVTRNWVLKGVRVIEGKMHLYLKELESNALIPEFTVVGDLP